jgi:hypothetical protein
MLFTAGSLKTASSKYLNDSLSWLQYYNPLETQRHLDTVKEDIQVVGRIRMPY